MLGSIPGSTGNEAAAASSRRLIVGITGASGAAIGVRLLELLRDQPIETHLVVSAWGGRTIRHETGLSLAEVSSLADVYYRIGDLGATISSGSYKTLGMVIAPCSVRTLAAIAFGLGGDLVTRAADVTLKESRKLVLVVRETPLNAIHLENMLKLSHMGATVFPPVPAFYTMPKSIDDVVDYMAVRILDQVGIDIGRPERWPGLDHGE